MIFGLANDLLHHLRGALQKLMKRKLLMLLIATGTVLSAQISVGIRIGPPPVMRMERMNGRSPGANYMWIDGYWYPERNRYKWHKGYWTRAPYAGARWNAPRHDGQQFFDGYWSKDQDRFSHDHRWDRDRNNRDNDRRR